MEINKITEKIEETSKKFDVIMRNRLTIAILLIVDGVNFIINPGGTIEFIARMIIFFVFIASCSVVITNFSSNKRDVKSLAISSSIIIVCIAGLIFPKVFATYLKIVLALFIAYDGIINISNTLKLNKLLEHTKEIGNTVRSMSKTKEISKELDEGIEEQKEKFEKVLNGVINKTDKVPFLYLGANIISVILGVLLLIVPEISMSLWGIIFIYTGISNLLVAMRTMNISKKIKEKDFKSILYYDE